MFYCESCAKKHGYPFEFYMPMSHGPCEICKETKSCVDVPSSRLPNKVRKKDGKPIPQPTDEPQTVPCEICGEPTQYTGTKRCNNCYEVESRLDRFLQNPKALLLITKKLRELELKHGAAQAIDEFPEDELEEYAAELKRTQEIILDAHLEDVCDWVRKSETGELRSFLNTALQLDRLTLQELKDKFASYLPDRCPHGEPIGDCNACDVAADLAYDAAREDRP